MAEKLVIDAIFSDIRRIKSKEILRNRDSHDIALGFSLTERKMKERPVPFTCAIEPYHTNYFAAKKGNQQSLDN